MQSVKVLSGVLAVAAVSGTNADILIVNSASDTVIRADNSGNILDANFIVLANSGVAPATPKAIAVVDNELWITDQLSDVIYRYTRSTTPTFIGVIGGANGGLDNMRGLAYIGGTVYVANSGTANGAPGAALVRISPAGTILGSFIVGDPFDVVEFNGNLLVANIADDSLDLYSPAGGFLSRLHDSDGVSGIDFPQQIFKRSNGNLLVGGFTAPSGIFEYNNTGAQLNYYSLSGTRGVLELADGTILWTQGSGLFRFNPATGSNVNAGSTTSCQYLIYADLQPSCLADFNGDGFVDGFDYDDFVACFEGDPCPPGKSADFNGDGFADGFDYDDFVAAFELGCS